MDPFDLRQWPGFVTAGGDGSNPAIIDQVVIDSRRVASPSSLFVALPGTSENGHQFVSHAAAQGIRYAIVSHSWQAIEASSSMCLLKVDSPLKALQQLAKAYRTEKSAKITAVTGSRGKTMLKDLLTAIVATTHPVIASPESFNSQIGVALSLFQISSQDRMAIIEAGVSRPNEMASLAAMIKPDHVIITNIGSEHISGLGSIEAILHEKLQLAADLPPQGWLLAPNQVAIHSALQSRYQWRDPHPSLPHAVPLPGSNGLSYRLTFPDRSYLEHRIEQTAAYYLDLVNIAAKAAWLLEIPSNQIAQALQTYRFETMRTEVWPCSQGATLINSSYSADPQSVDIALQRLREASPQGRKIFVFGGLRSSRRFLQSDLKRVGQAIRSCGVDMLTLYGEQDLSPLVEELEKMATHPQIDHFVTLDQALTSLSAQSHPSDYILLKGPHKAPLRQIVESFGDDIASNICTINLVAVSHNIDALRQRLPPDTRLMVMVKALAYGTQDIRMAKFLKGCRIDILGVSFVDEAINLRRAGVTQTVFALNAVPSEVHQIVRWNIEVGVSEDGLINALATEAARQQAVVRTHLHVDTGMGRFGCRPEDALVFAKKIVEHPNLVLEGIMTHLACSESPNKDAFTQQQYKTFLQTIHALKAHGISPSYIHAANSGAVIRHHFAECNMARIGLAIFGLHGSEVTRDAIDLKLALSLTSRIVGINQCRQGETIGYGRSYTTTRAEERIAILPLGYFDGLHRQFSGKGHVLIRGRKAVMVGNICMDYMMVDVTDIPDAMIGDEVLIFGHDEQGNYVAPEEFAADVGSVAHEIISCLGPRIKRLFIYE